MKKYNVYCSDILVGEYILYDKFRRFIRGNEEEINKLPDPKILDLFGMGKSCAGIGVHSLNNRIRDCIRFGNDEIIGYHTDSIELRKVLDMDFIIEDNRIYSVDNEGKIIAEINYSNIDEDTVDINRTFVDESLRGKGIAYILVDMAVYEIKKTKGKNVVASCSYAKNWLIKH